MSAEIHAIFSGVLQDGVAEISGAVTMYLYAGHQLIGQTVFRVQSLLDPTVSSGNPIQLLEVYRGETELLSSRGEPLEHFTSGKIDAGELFVFQLFLGLLTVYVTHDDEVWLTIQDDDLDPPERASLLELCHGLHVV